MKVRWSIEECPEPRGLKYYIICLLAERADILCRLIVQSFTATKD